MLGLLLILVLAALLAVSLRWVWHDARRHGHDPRLAVAVALLCWPVGLSLWVFIRSGYHLAPSGWGSAWG